MSTTNALRFLRQRGIPHTVREYEHKVKGALYAAEAVGFPVAAMAKTLVVALSDRTYAQCLVPGDVELSLKKLARVAQVKSVRMTHPEEAEKLTGYRVGGISPFGTRKRLPIWIHESLLEYETIGVNGGRRGLIVLLRPGHVRDALEAKTADLAARTIGS
jgi:Cys-tRNA(Pro)/Cys-tRNA(Cys) deacylase